MDKLVNPDGCKARRLGRLPPTPGTCGLYSSQRGPLTPIFSLLQCAFSRVLSTSPSLPPTFYRPLSLSSSLSLRVALILLSLVTFSGSWLCISPSLCVSGLPRFPEGLIPSHLSGSHALLLPQLLSPSLSSSPTIRPPSPAQPSPAQPPPWSRVLPWIAFEPQGGAEPQKFHRGLREAPPVSPPPSSVQSREAQNRRVPPCSAGAIAPRPSLLPPTR